KVLRTGAGAGAIFFMLVGVYFLFEIATGYSSDLFVQGFVSGFGPDVTPFQKAIPLLIMVATLLIIPKGLFSLRLPRLRRNKE
ncbi:MAG TPA: hypothetical protein VFE91_02135, partial [Nitrososphaerales archaeon]|nr:hypothetical protein [Nitrososphaerales archaeon]